MTTADAFFAARAEFDRDFTNDFKHYYSAFGDNGFMLEGDEIIVEWIMRHMPDPDTGSEARYAYFDNLNL